MLSMFVLFGEVLGLCSYWELPADVRGFSEEGRGVKEMFACFI